MAEQGALVMLGSWLLGIPYLGAWLGAIPLVLIALLSGGIVKALLALGLTFLVNGFDSNIVQPRIQVKALEVHAPLPPVVNTVPGRAGETTTAHGEGRTAPTGVAVRAEERCAGRAQREFVR